MPLPLYVSPSVSLSALLTPNRDGIYREATCDVRRPPCPAPLLFSNLARSRHFTLAWRGAQTSIMHEDGFVAPNDQIEGEGRERRTVTLLLPESRARDGVSNLAAAAARQRP